MNRPTPPGPLHAGAKLAPDESTMKTDTPRTDIMVTGNSDPTQDEYEDLAAFARQLERECTALRKAVKPATEELIRKGRAYFDALDHYHAIDAPGGHRLSAMSAAREELRAAIAKHQGRA